MTTKLAEKDCIQILQNLENRYLNETIGWLLATLTIITIDLNVIKEIYKLNLDPNLPITAINTNTIWTLLIGGLLFSILSVVLVVNILGTFSAFTASRIINNVFAGNKAMFELTSKTLSCEEELEKEYCSRTEFPNYNKYKARLDQLSNDLITRCVHIVMLNNYKISYDIDYHKLVASKMVLATRSASPMNVLKEILVSLVVFAIFYILLRISLVKTMIMYYIVVIIFLFYLMLNKGFKPKEISDSKTCNQESRVDRILKNYIKNNKSKRCKMGLDEVTLFCFKSHIHHCPSITNITKPALVPALLVTMFLQLNLILLT